MSQFHYSDEEKSLNKVLKMNRDLSDTIANDPELALLRRQADASIKSSQVLLRSLGKSKEIEALSKCNQQQHETAHLKCRPQIE